MDLLTTLHRSGGIVALSRQLDASPVKSGAAVEALLPQVSAAYLKMHDSAGADALIAMFAEFGGVSLAAEIMGIEPVDPARGQAILDRLEIGSAVDGADADRELRERMLPLLAMLTGGYLSGMELSRRGGREALLALLGGGSAEVEPDVRVAQRR